MAALGLVLDFVVYDRGIDLLHQFHRVTEEVHFSAEVSALSRQGLVLVLEFD